MNSFIINQPFTATDLLQIIHSCRVASIRNGHDTDHADFPLKEIITKAEALLDEQIEVIKRAEDEEMLDLLEMIDDVRELHANDLEEYRKFSKNLESLKKRILASN